MPVVVGSLQATITPKRTQNLLVIPIAAIRDYGSVAFTSVAVALVRITILTVKSDRRENYHTVSYPTF